MIIPPCIFMARQPRFILPGYPQHVIQRGNNKQTIFLSNADFKFFLEKTKEAIERYQCELHAYVLMTNHFHFLMTPLKEDSISKTIQMIGRCYVQYFNKKYQRTGTLWEGRYKASLVDTASYLFTCMRYIELNPVRAGIVAHPSMYLWSSYKQNVLGEFNPLIKSHAEYNNLAGTTLAQQFAYGAMFNQPIDEVVLAKIRHTSNKSWVLGTEKFINDTQKLVTRGVKPASRGGDRKSSTYLKINRL